MDYEGVKNKALEYLLKSQWNCHKECPECLGLHPTWLGRSGVLSTNNLGHKPTCELAHAIRDLGGEVLFVGEFRPIQELEYFHQESSDGWGVRPKTENGCPVRVLYEGFINEEVDRIFAPPASNEAASW